jgi:hypothetical protein
MALTGESRTDNSWLFAAAFEEEGDADGYGYEDREPDEAPRNRGKLLVGLLLLLGLGIVAIGLVIMIAPSVNAFGGCGGG